MKNLAFITIICLTFISIKSFAQTSNVLQTDEAISVSWNNTEYSFGDIKQSNPQTVEFELTNNGDTPVIISDVRTSCGCTVAGYSKEPIAKGTSTKISVTYNAANIGTFSKTITVTMNPGNIVQALKISGNVVSQ